MDEPDQRDGEREVGRTAPEPIAKRRQDESPAHDAEQQQRARDVNRDVDDVVAADSEAADGVIQGERDVDRGAAGDGKLERGKEHDRGRPQLPNLLVHDNRVLIVEHERP